MQRQQGERAAADVLASPFGQVQFAHSTFVEGGGDDWHTKAVSVSRVQHQQHKNKATRIGPGGPVRSRPIQIRHEKRLNIQQTTYRPLSKKQKTKKKQNCLHWPSLSGECQ